AQRARMRVYAHQLDARLRQRNRNSAGTDAQVEDRRLRLTGPAKPRFGIGDVQQLRVELREAFVGVLGVVADEGWVAHRAFRDPPPRPSSARGAGLWRLSGPP